MTVQPNALGPFHALDIRTPIVAQSSTPLRSEFGDFTLNAFETAKGRELLAMVAGDLTEEQPLVRIQSACATGAILHSHLCDCRQQLHESLELVGRLGGVVLLLDDDGRGHGMVEKVAQLRLIAAGLDTVDAAATRGKSIDLRTYDEAVAVLRTLVGAREVRLLTNNPAKVAALEEAGLVVAERLPIEPEPTITNRAYLEAKKLRLGHLLTRI